MLNIVALSHFARPRSIPKLPSRMSPFASTRIPIQCDFHISIFVNITITFLISLCLKRFHKGCYFHALRSSSWPKRYTIKIRHTIRRLHPLFFLLVCPRNAIIIRGGRTCYFERTVRCQKWENLYERCFYSVSFFTHSLQASETVTFGRSVIFLL